MRTRFERQKQCGQCLNPRKLNQFQNGFLTVIDSDVLTIYTKYTAKRRKTVKCAATSSFVKANCRCKRNDGNKLCVRILFFFSFFSLVHSHFESDYLFLLNQKANGIEIKIDKNNCKINPKLLLSTKVRIRS